MKIKSKRIFSNIVVLSIFIFVAQIQVLAITPVSADVDNVNVSVEEKDLKNDEAGIIQKYSIKNKFKRSPETQIRNFIKKYNKYSESDKIDKLKELYSDSYINNDGFDKKGIFELMKDASGLYKNVKYNTEIKNIKINGSNAQVDLYETAKGETIKSIEKFDGTGIIESEMNYVNYLRKENGEWKLLASDVRNEKVSIKYGEAKTMDADVISPDYVPAGSDYEVSVKLRNGITKIPVEEEGIELETVAPDGLFVVGSITNELIKYPQESSKDVLRAVKSDELARILKANKEGYNEYATVSLGITRVVLDPPSVAIKMTGMAIIIKRINTFPLKNTLIKEKEKDNVCTKSKK